jgi:ligand-binding sensor domain-containing protein
MFGVDVNGDFWLQWTISRGQPTLRFEGHVPPRDMPWPDINVDMSSKHDPLDCSWWRIFHSGSISYRSPEECQRLVKVHAVINQQQVYGPLAADTDGTFWRANDTTLYHLAVDGSTLPQFPVSMTYRLAADPTHGVWLAAREGLFFSDGKTLQRISIGLEKYTLYPTGSIVIDASGTVWAASGRGLQRFDADTQRWSLVDDAQLSNMLNMANIEGFAAASDGGVWITTDRDLLHYDGKMITTMPLPEPRCGLRGLGVDPTGNVWFPSLNCGIVQFDPATKVWQHHQPSSNEFDVDVDHLSIGSDGSVYAAGVSGELWVYSPTARTWRFVAHIKKSINESESITADNHGGVWVTQSAEIRHYPDGFSFVLDPEVAGFRSYRIFADQRSNLWIATEDKLYLYDGKDLRLIASPPISPVGAMSAAPDGRLWFAGQRGVAVYDPAGDNQP